MSYAAIMVYVEPDRSLSGRVELANGLAQNLGCELIGASAWMQRPPFVVEGVVVDPAPGGLELQAMQTALNKTGEQFRAAIAAKGRTAHWRSGLEFPTEFLARECRAADLVIVGRDPSPHDAFRHTDAGALVLRTGRPVLVVPHDINTLEVKRALIAWKDTREARRAIRDALPLLRKAKEVMVVEIAESGRSDEVFHAQARLSDVVEYLQRHQIGSVANRVIPADGGVSSSLVRMATEQSFDLIVAGAYGHSRLGEWLFGGMTQELLSSCPVCCLLSH